MTEHSDFPKRFFSHVIAAAVLDSRLIPCPVNAIEAPMAEEAVIADWDILRVQSGAHFHKFPNSRFPPSVKTKPIAGIPP